jgi:hypothetical protein
METNFRQQCAKKDEIVDSENPGKKAIQVANFTSLMVNCCGCQPFTEVLLKMLIA